MTYASCGLIQATDYNSLANTINSTWNAVYGQTSVPNNLSAGAIVTAAQWSTLIGAVNACNIHQTGSGVASLPAAGDIITYLAAVNTQANALYGNRFAYYAQGGTTTGGNFAVNPSNGDTRNAYGTTIVTRNVSFSSAAAAQYFFNAGGKLNFVVSSVSNNGGTAAGADLATLIQTEFNSVNNFGANNNSGRGGSGGSLTTNNGSVGYYNAGTSPNMFVSVTSTGAAYTSDYVNFYVAVNGATVTFYLNLYQGAHAYQSSWNVTVNHRVDVIYPETNYLGNSWGTPSIS